jgi:uncharacterized protein
MSEMIKLSKYNFYAYDPEGNLIIYNFLKGISSLTKISECDVPTFKMLFMDNAETYRSSCNKYIESLKTLMESGLLVDANTDESILYESKYYEQIYDNKLVLTVLPTGNCNLNCSYCLESEQNLFRGSMTVEAQKALLQFVQRQIHNYKELQVSWFGGEPLVEPRIVRYLSENFIKICDMRFLPYSAQITTNGFCLDENMFDILYNLKVFTYMVTVDGFKNQHDKLRVTRNGLGTYDKIMGNLMRIHNSKQYKFAHIVIRVNITKSILNILDDFIYYLASLFSDDPRFAFIFVPAENYAKDRCSNNDIFVDGEEVFGRLIQNEIYMNRLYSEKFKLQLITPGEGCPSNTKNAYVIAPDLKVYKCCAHYDMNANHVGEINSKGDLLLNEALHSKWYLINKYIPRKTDKCKECFYLPMCDKNARGCPAQYIGETQKVNSCPLTNEKFINALNESVLYAARKYPCVQLDL